MGSSEGLCLLRGSHMPAAAGWHITQQAIQLYPTTGVQAGRRRGGQLHHCFTAGVSAGTWEGDLRQEALV